jgi:hypothetical protein
MVASSPRAAPSRAAALLIVALLIQASKASADVDRDAASWHHATGMEELGLEQAGQQANHMRQLLQNADVPALTPKGGLLMEGECADAGVSAVMTAVALYRCH